MEYVENAAAGFTESKEFSDMMNSADPYSAAYKRGMEIRTLVIAKWFETKTNKPLH